MAEQVIQCKSACKGYTTMETPYIIREKTTTFYTNIQALRCSRVYDRYSIDILASRFYGIVPLKKTTLSPLQ